MKWTGRILVGLVVLALAVSGLSSLASAHDYFLGSDPADGATLAQAPSQIRLEFSAAPQAVAPRIKVSAAGAVVAEGDLALDGKFATFPVKLEAGVFTVEWTVVSSDGHRIEGTFGFTVTAPTPAATASPDPSILATPPVTKLPVSPSPSPMEGSPSPVASPSSSATVAAVTNDGVPLWQIVAGLVGLAVLVGAILVAVKRSRTKR